MANKNLVKRAFSVTANLPPPVAPETQVPPAGDASTDDGAAGQAVPCTSPAPSVPAGYPGGAAASVPAQPLATVPRTGPGSMLAFMTDQSEVHKEVVHLRERMSAFHGAEITRPIDPALVRASRWANRDASHFDTDAFAKLKEEIVSAGRNVQPIKVRPVTDEPKDGVRYEIVYGHRRHRACLELGLPVYALIQESMKDSELFVEMERENRNREDLSAWEQGVMYMRALEQGLFPSAKQLAAAIDRDMSNISRAMALAKLPGDVVRAFGSPLNLQFRWATQLKDAHQRDPERLLSAARALSQQQPAPTPAEVFAALTRSGTSASATNASAAQWKDAEGNPLAALRSDRKGRVTLSIEQPMDEAQRRKLIKLVDAFLGVKS